MNPPVQDPIAFALASVEAGRRAVLGTVVETWGSAPRRPGHHMAIDEAGAFRGSVSGGCVEVAVVDAARRCLEGGDEVDLHFGVADEEAWAVGLACGGTIRVLLSRVGAGETEVSPALLRAALEAERGGGAQCLAFDLSHGGVRAATAFPEFQAEVARAVGADLALRVDGADGPCFLRPYFAPVRVIIIGAVHIAQPLSDLCRTAGFTPIVVDPRDDFATSQRFPGVELVREWPESGLRGLALDARSAVVALTHDPKLDDPALSSALESPAFYVGALGSRRSHASRCARLADAGVAREAIDRIHGPVGLDLGGRAPAEIAVSILAEIVAELRGGSAARARAAPRNFSPA